MDSAERLKNERTRNQGRMEKIKKLLREEYRLAAKARGEANAIKESLQRSVLMAEARRHSARIDQLRIELQIKQSESEQEKKYWEELRRREHYAQCWKQRKSIEFCNNRINALYKQIGYIKKQQAELGFFEIQERQALEYEIETIKERIADEYLEREALRWSKSVLKDMVKNDRKERRAEKKNENTKAKEKKKELVR